MYVRMCSRVVIVHVAMGGRRGAVQGRVRVHGWDGLRARGWMDTVLLVPAILNLAVVYRCPAACALGARWVQDGRCELLQRVG